MILSRHDGALRLVRQVEHGRIAGELAAAWGNPEVETPSPVGSVVTAAARHDDGWRAVDERVLVNEAEHRPLHFLEIEAREHVRLYRRGVGQVDAADVYAGLLIGMHWTGLYRGRWSAPGATGRLGGGAGDDAVLDRVVRTEERRWVDARVRAWHQPCPRAEFEARLWHNYELLQLWDLLSLHLSVASTQPAAGDAEVWGPQLRQLQHTPRPVVLPAVALRPGGPRRAVTATVTAAGTVTLDPFPLRGHIDLAVEVSVIPDRGGTPAEVRERARRAPSRTLPWRLQPVGSPA